MANNNRTNAFGALIVVLLLSGGFAATSSTSNDSSTDGDSSSTLTECEDLFDNDSDGFIDSEDTSCDPSDPSYDGTEDGIQLPPL